MADLDSVIAGYRRLRDHKKELKEQHTLELRPINDKMEAMESYMALQLQNMGVESAKGPNGTAYTTITTSVKITDREMLVAYLSEQGENIGTIDLKVNPIAAEDYIKLHNRPIPGTEVSRRANTRVRK